MRVLHVVALAALAGLAAANCPNACSGNGDCSTNYDFCICYTGYTGPDCSQRICQFAHSYIDSPVGDLTYDNALTIGGFATTAQVTGVPANKALNPQWHDDGYWERHPSQLWGGPSDSGSFKGHLRAQEGHFYYECSNRGLCDRETGQCQCFTGYEGAACNRTVCPNACSGHGTCESISEVTPSNLYYDLWDADKTFQCSCDGGYEGPDCSLRSCRKDDDPLTTTASTVDLNEGVTEAGEIQEIYIRCPGAGVIPDEATFSLTYTDVQFGDEYVTDAINVKDVDTTAESTMRSALESLPNQVLARMTQDGVDFGTRVTGVTIDALETDNYYKYTVTFDSRLGNVPMLKATSNFKCLAGSLVDLTQGDAWAHEDVTVTRVGDGPTEYRKIVIYDITVAAADVGDVLVYDAAGAVVGEGTLTFAAGAVSIAFNARDEDREAAKVTFTFENGATSAGRAFSKFVIELPVDPAVSVNVKLFTLLDGASAGQNVMQDRATNGLVYQVRDGVNQEGFHILVNDYAATPSYDMNLKLVISAVTAGDASEYFLYINDEFIGIMTAANVAATPPVMRSVNTRVPADFNAVWAGVGWTDTTIDTTASEVGDYFEWSHPKTPFTRSNTRVDTINTFFTKDKAITHSVFLVLKIVTVSSDPDTYAWKVAGDPTFMDNSGAGYNIPPVSSWENVTLDALDSYLAMYPDDLERLQVHNIHLQWTNGEDYDQRVCGNTVTDDSDKYYIIFGAEGINDTPVCSDRGSCDYSTGVCNCFAGYSGWECSSQVSVGY